MNRDFSQRQRFSILIKNALLITGIAWRTSAILFLSVIGFSLILSFIPAIQVWVARELINTVIAALDDPDNQSKLILWIGISLGSAVLQAFATLGRQYFMRRFDDMLRLKISMDIMTHAASLDVAMFDSGMFQDTLERARNNIAFRIAHFIDDSLRLLTFILETVAIVGLLVVIQPLIVLVMIGITIPYGIFYWRQGKAAYALEYNRVEKRRWMSYYTSLLLSRESMTEVKLLNLPPHLIQQYECLMHEFINQDRKLYTRRFIGSFVFSITFAIVIFFVMLWIISQVLAGILTVGDIAVYVGAANRLRNNLEQSSQIFTGLLEDVLYAHDLAQFLETKPIMEHEGTQTLTNVQGEIELSNVTFKYPGTEKDVLQNVSLTIKPGEIIAIVGKNGAGKSTLVKLLACLYQPTKGDIRLDGVSMREIELTSIYRQIAFMLQTYNRYEATAAENIAYGDWVKLLTQTDKVRDIAKDVGITDFIDNLPQGYDTQLGRRFGDVDLSGGQWQKLALARAFAREASIVILDEPSSSLDPMAEHQLIEQFRKLRNGRTTIMISHRFSTVKGADRIVVMDEGKIVECGSHSELMSQVGLYAELYELHRQHFDMEE